MIGQLRFGAGVLLLLLPQDYEAVSLLAVRGMLQVALLVSHQKSSLTFSMIRAWACLGVVPCPGLDPWYPLP